MDVVLGRRVVTCIVGLTEGGRVWIGGDSASSDRSTIQAHLGRKVARLSIPVPARAGGRPHDLLVGYTTSWRFGDLLTHAFRPPEYDDERSGNFDTYLRTTWMAELRRTLAKGGWRQKKDEREEGGEALLGTQGRLWILVEDFGLSEVEIGAVGSGGQVALGALAAARRGGSSPEEAVTIALETAAELTCYVRPPWTILSTGGEP